MGRKIYIFDRDAEENPVYSTWLDALTVPYEIVTAMPSSWEPPDDASLIVTHQHYQWDYITTLRRVMRRGRVPILILSDGILEFRNTFENPEVAPGAVFLPMLGHKLACIGRAPARQLEAMGNQAKCEVVGHPRFDQLEQLPPVPTQVDGDFRLLVTSARTPAFDQQQYQQVLLGFQQLANRFHRNPMLQQRRVVVSWRLPDSLLSKLDLPSDAQTGITGSLTDAIDSSDAVITTPSTVYLESCIRRRPTALLNYTHSPLYVPAAWTIEAESQINPVLEQLEEPTEARMLFQRINLADQVELDGNATHRLTRLMDSMIEIGEASRRDNEPLTFPNRILSPGNDGMAHADPELELPGIFPNSTAHQLDDKAMLQQELAHAIAALKQMPQMIHDRNEVIQRKSNHIEFLTELMEEHVAEIRELRARVRLLESRQALQNYKQEAKRLAEKLSALLQLDEEAITPENTQGQSAIKIFRAG